MTNATETIETEAIETAEADSSVVRRLANAAKRINETTATVLGIYAKADEKVLQTIYAKNGLMVNLKAYYDAGGRLGGLADRHADRRTYDLLSDAGRVLRKFGTDKPARFTAWGAIVRATTLSEETIASIGTEDVVTVRDVTAAVSAAKSPKPEADAPKAEPKPEPKGTQSVVPNAAADPIAEMGTSDLVPYVVELAARFGTGDACLTADEMTAVKGSLGIILKAMKTAATK